MKVIVSKDLLDNFTHFVVVRNFEELNKLSNVEVVIVHSFEESGLDAGMALSELYNKGIKLFLYINENPISSLMLAMRGVGGKVYTDEFYLQDEEELTYLVNEVSGLDGNETTEVALTSAQVIKDFIGSFMRHEDRVNTPLYLEQVQNAIIEIESSVRENNTQLSVIGESALETFNRVSEVINGLNEQKKKLEAMLAKLEQTPSTPTRAAFSNGVITFPSYKYVGTKKVLLIREVAPCRYLTSFLLAYRHYLQYRLNKRAKLIFVHQKGAYISKKYDKFPSITDESKHMKTLFDESVIATNSPKAEVFKELFEKPEDIFIIVDRLYGNNDIVTGRISKLHAVGGLSDLTRFKLQKNNCIFPVSAQEGAFFTIPTFNKYPKEQDNRFVGYVQICQDRFNLLDDFLQLPKE